MCRLYLTVHIDLLGKGPATLYQGLHMLALTACGTGCGRLARGPLMCEWFSTLELRLALRLMVLC